MALACNGPFHEALKFPVKTDVKIIIENHLSQVEAKGVILKICEELEIKTTWKGLKESRGGKFNSYTIVVVFKNKPEMQLLYEKLGEIIGVRMVL